MASIATRKFILFPAGPGGYVLARRREWLSIDKACHLPAATRWWIISWTAKKQVFVVSLRGPDG